MVVFVLDRTGKPLMPCTEKRARLMLERGRARVHRLIPFCIRLVDRSASDNALQPITFKIDPGSKFTGVALVREGFDVDTGTGEASKTTHVLFLAELLHRGYAISEALTSRAQKRRRRRSKNLRYRAPRFLNRGNKKAGWIAPSLKHRIDTTLSWLARFRRWAPVTAIAQELVRFDMQALENPEIEGAQYQRGTLAGTEVREYLLAKWDRKCCYCGAENTPLNIEHLHPKARGGSDRISNLSIACVPCNQKKGSRTLEDFLAGKPELLKHITAQAKRPLKDAAAVNSTRWALFNLLKATGLEVCVGSGGLTKFNRTRLGVPKTHALDAVCVGDCGEVTGWDRPTLAIKCTGRGTYQRTRADGYGFPRGYLMRTKGAKGFQTGDMVRASVPKGKHAGEHFGRVAVRASGSFNISTATGLITVGYKNCRVVQRADGYGYSTIFKPHSHALKDVVSRAA